MEPSSTTWPNEPSTPPQVPTSSAGDGFYRSKYFFFMGEGVGAGCVYFLGGGV